MTVPVHAGRDIRPGALWNILRGHGRTVDDLRWLRVPCDVYDRAGGVLRYGQRPGRAGPTGIAAASPSGWWVHLAASSDDIAGRGPGTAGLGASAADVVFR